jgi:hypothetical protein
MEAAAARLGFVVPPWSSFGRQAVPALLTAAGTRSYPGSPSSAAAIAR